MSGLAELERKRRELEHAYRAQTPARHGGAWTEARLRDYGLIQ